MVDLSAVIPLATAAVLGFLHALEIDHMLAVTAFVSRRPALAGAARFGLRWGIGHSLAVFLAGGVLLATGLRWPARWDSYGEAAVGLMLTGIGLWSLRATRNLHLHPADAHGGHAHLHQHRMNPGLHGQLAPNRGHAHENAGSPETHTHGGPHAHAHHHSRGMTLVGLVHGLAGTSAVVALVPVTLLDQVSVGFGYLVAFGLGTTVAMTLFALVAALAMRRAAERSVALGRRIVSSVGIGGIAVGGWWIWRAIAGA